MAANDNEATEKPKKKAPTSDADARRARQAEALRANLRKRKDQARRRQGVPDRAVAEQDTAKESDAD